MQYIFAFENAVGVPAGRWALGGWVSDKCRVNQSRIRLLADPFIEFYFNGNGKKKQKTLLSSTEDKIHGTFYSVTYVLESTPFESFLSTF